MTSFCCVGMLPPLAVGLVCSSPSFVSFLSLSFCLDVSTFIQPPSGDVVGRACATSPYERGGCLTSLEKRPLLRGNLWYPVTESTSRRLCRRPGVVLGILSPCAGPLESLAVPNSDDTIDRQLSTPFHRTSNHPAYSQQKAAP
ncbi:hypothetical protein LX36DRAFT_246684 [Colletotrichum falcatum]|nr:hypothetical protein LX36DRAFT_246684 [Colletotrichum falcatum]